MLQFISAHAGNISIGAVVTAFIMLQVVVRLVKDVRKKKLVWLYTWIGTSLVFLIILYSFQIPIRVFAVAILVFAVVLSLYWRSTVFCENCGKMNQGAAGSKPARVCKKCNHVFGTLTQGIQSNEIE